MPVVYLLHLQPHDALSLFEALCVAIAGLLALYHAASLTVSAMSGVARQSPTFAGGVSKMYDPRWLYAYMLLNLLEFWDSWALGNNASRLFTASIPLIAAQVALTLEAYSRLRFTITTPGNFALAAFTKDFRIGIACLIGANALAAWDTYFGGAVHLLWIWIALNASAVAFYLLVWYFRDRLAVGDRVAYRVLWGLALATVIVMVAESVLIASARSSTSL
jgi:hypothetical protein